MCVQNSKFVALPVTEITGGYPQKIGQSMDTPTAFVRMYPVNVPAKFEDRSFTRSAVPEIIAIGVLGGVANPQSWGRGGCRGSEIFNPINVPCPLKL